MRSTTRGAPSAAGRLWGEVRIAALMQRTPRSGRPSYDAGSQVRGGRLGLYDLRAIEVWERRPIQSRDQLEAVRYDHGLNTSLFQSSNDDVQKGMDSAVCNHRAPQCHSDGARTA
jgi:hypothetical protein